MAKTTRRFGLGVVAAMAMTLAQPAMAGEPTVVLHIQNLAQIPLQPLKNAQAIATQIYDAIGVRVVWSDEAAASVSSPAMHVTVVLASGDSERRMLAQARLSSVTLGVAPRDTSRAYIFCDRVSDLARFTSHQVDLVLGRVLAHEVGHQLLPAKGHSNEGIMRAMLDYQSPASPKFTRAQGESIRALLMATDQAPVQMATVSSAN